MTEKLLRTPLYERHLALEAKMVPFAGYDMPVQYPTGIKGNTWRCVTRWVYLM